MQIPTSKIVQRPVLNHLFTMKFQNVSIFERYSFAKKSNHFKIHPVSDNVLSFYLTDTKIFTLFKNETCIPIVLCFTGTTFESETVKKRNPVILSLILFPTATIHRSLVVLKMFSLLN